MSDGLYDWLLFLHILAGMVWVGGGVLLAALVTRVLHDPEPRAVAHQSRTAMNADRAAARGDHEVARRQLARWSWGYRLLVLLLIAATWDMVAKPGL
jgi:uncharacterized membrane protein